MSCAHVGVEYVNFQITRFSDYSLYLANKNAYDFYNKAAKWYENNKDNDANYNDMIVKNQIKNLYKALMFKRKFPMANMLMRTIINHTKTPTINATQCKTLKKEAEQEVCKCGAY